MQKRNPAGERLLAESLAAVHLQHSAGSTPRSSALMHSSLFFPLSHGGDASSALCKISALKPPSAPASAAVQAERIYQQSSQSGIFRMERFRGNSLCKPPTCAHHQGAGLQRILELGILHRENVNFSNCQGAAAVPQIHALLYLVLISSCPAGTTASPL